MSENWKLYNQADDKIPFFAVIQVMEILKHLNKIYRKKSPLKTFKYSNKCIRLVYVFFI